jgi:hypothetical protein
MGASYTLIFQFKARNKLIFDFKERCYVGRAHFMPPPLGILLPPSFTAPLAMLLSLRHALPFWACYCPLAMLLPLRHAVPFWSCYCPLAMLLPLRHAVPFWACYCPLAMLLPLRHAVPFWACYYPLGLLLPLWKVFS